MRNKKLEARLGEFGIDDAQCAMLDEADLREGALIIEAGAAKVKEVTGCGIFNARRVIKSLEENPVEPLAETLETALMKAGLISSNIESLKMEGAREIEEVASLTPNELAAITGIGLKKAEEVIRALNKPEKVTSEQLDDNLEVPHPNSVSATLKPDGRLQISGLSIKSKSKSFRGLKLRFNYLIGIDNRLGIRSSIDSFDIDDIEVLAFPAFLLDHAPTNVTKNLSDTVKVEVWIVSGAVEAKILELLVSSPL